MCLIVFAYKMHADYPLIFAGNRDEIYGRPTEDARIWNTEPEMVAGRDLKAGGTWAGINANGRMSAITNFRDIKSIKPAAPSRGHIVKDSLLTSRPVGVFMEDLSKKASLFNGFNLLTGSADELYWLNSVRQDVIQLEPGIYGLSNAYLDTPWPKVTSTKQAFELTFYDNLFEPDPYFNILLDPTTYSQDLPETGLPPEIEKAVSAAFIQTPSYGTRCSTFIRIHRNGQFLFEERTYRPGSSYVNSRTLVEGDANNESDTNKQKLTVVSASDAPGSLRL